MGFAIIGVTLRLLFDSSVTVLFFPTGNYVVGHCLIAAGSIMAVFGILGLIGIMSENSCLIWTVIIELIQFDSIDRFNSFLYFYFKTTVFHDGLVVIGGQYRGWSSSLQSR